MKNYKKLIIIVNIIIIAYVLIDLYLNVTLKTLGTDIKDFSPLRDDKIAERFAPVIVSDKLFGFPVKLFYRASENNKGNIHIAYHFVWDYERNDSSGLMPFLNRILYTGGLKIQQIMFGKEDVEVIGIILNKKKKIIEIQFETPENYNPGSFLVTHRNMSIKGSFEKPFFKVVSWNHLFEFIPADKRDVIDDERMARLKPAYFTREHWTEYTMLKSNETRLKRSRAHFPWERECAE